MSEQYQIEVVKGTTLPWRLSENGMSIIDADGEVQVPGHHLKRIIAAVNAHADLLAACKAAVLYDQEVAACANDPDRMASHCTAQGESLDSLYLDWMTKAKMAIKLAEGK